MTLDDTTASVPTPDAPAVETAAETATVEALPLLTASSLKTARACLRLYLLTYEQGWRPATAAAELRFGTLVHRGLEAWWRAAGNGQGDARLDAALEAMAGESDPFDRARAECLLTGYHARWEADRYDVLAVEAPFVAALRNPATGKPSRTWRLAGKLDAVVRDPAGRVLIVEHKTSSEQIGPGSEYWRRLRMDGQVSQYYEGARALGYDVEGCLYDVLGKPAIRPLKATPPEARKYTKDGALYKTQRDQDESPDEFRDRLSADIGSDPVGYYQQGEVVRLDAEMAEALQDTWQIGATIREARRTGCHPRNPDACVRYGRTCWAFDLCTGAASLDDATRFVRIGNIHPELDSGATGAA